MLCDDLEGWDGWVGESGGLEGDSGGYWGGGRAAQEGGVMCIRIADSFCCTAETSTTL